MRILPIAAAFNASPLHSRIEAWNSKGAVEICAADLHGPNTLRDGWVGRGLQGEGAVFSEAPQNSSGAGAIGIIDLHDPVLVPYGNKKVAVIFGVEDSVGVSPVREEQRMTVGIEVIELIPRPHGLHV